MGIHTTDIVIVPVISESLSRTARRQVGKTISVQVRYSPDTRPRRGQVYAAVLTSFLAGFFRAGGLAGIPTLKTS